LEANVADFRLRKIAPRTPLTEGPSAAPTGNPAEVHRRKISPQALRKILDLLDAGESISVVAARFGLGQSTIRRIIATRDDDL
jgi:hypothetical protein